MLFPGSQDPEIISCTVSRLLAFLSRKNGREVLPVAFFKKMHYFLTNVRDISNTYFEVFFTFAALTVSPWVCLVVVILFSFLIWWFSFLTLVFLLIAHWWATRVLCSQILVWLWRLSGLMAAVCL